jgi:serine/threonine protein kinase
VTLSSSSFKFCAPKSIHYCAGGEKLLGWEVRYKVAIGVCKALEYLHDGIPRPVIHVDVKASNILLSHDFQPQVPSHIHSMFKNYWVCFWVLRFPLKLSSEFEKTL